MAKFFEFFNYFSQVPSLKVNGKEKPKSTFGSIIGIFSMSILIAVITYIMIEYFSKLNYTYTSYTDNLVSPNIDLKDFKLGFKITNATAGEIPELERLFEISALYWIIHIPRLGDNTTSTTAKPYNIPIIKCDKYKNGTIFYEDFASNAKNFKNFFCLDFESLNKNLTGAYGNIGG